MSKEIEAQIINIDYDDCVNKIKKLGAKINLDWIKFNIAMFHPCLTEQEQQEKYSMIYTRVRDEGNNIVSITTKTKPKSSDSKFVNEFEIHTNNTFEECKNLLLANHLHMKSFHEKLRQKWIIPSKPEIKEIVFDIWPGLPMYMEIEAKTEKDLLDFIKELNINDNNIRYTNGLYNEILGIDEDVINNKTPELKFISIKNSIINNVSDKNNFLSIVNNQQLFLHKIGFSHLIHPQKRLKINNSKKNSKKNSNKNSKKKSKKNTKNSKKNSK